MRVIPLCVVLGGWLSMPAFGADDASVWLDRMASSEKKQSYEGTFVYERNGSFSSHAVWQRVDGEHRHERLVQLDGPASEVRLTDGKVQCATMDMAAQVPEQQPWRHQQFKPDVLSKVYSFKVMGESRVAGRSTLALAVSPRDQHRYGFELHLDRETALPLKSLLLDESGQLLERFQFTNFSPKPISDALLEAGPDCQSVSLAEVEKKESSGWRSDWIPDGFQLIDSNVRTSPASDQPVTWLSYSDGLARVSVFIEPLDGAVVEDTRSQMGPTVAVSKRISTASGDVMVTVVGEVPLGTAERIALSMRSGADSTPQ